MLKTSTPASLGPDLDALRSLDERLRWLSAWTIQTPYTANNARVTWERNPYYWKVDTAGNQLPYIDGITWAKLDDPQLMALKMTSLKQNFW